MDPPVTAARRPSTASAEQANAGTHAARTIHKTRRVFQGDGVTDVRRRFRARSSNSIRSELLPDSRPHLGGGAKLHECYAFPLRIMMNRSASNGCQVAEMEQKASAFRRSAEPAPRSRRTGSSSPRPAKRPSRTPSRPSLVDEARAGVGAISRRSSLGYRGQRRGRRLVLPDVALRIRGRGALLLLACRRCGW
jgi:hypothetical protein